MLAPEPTRGPVAAHERPHEGAKAGGVAGRRATAERVPRGPVGRSATDDGQHAAARPARRPAPAVGVREVARRRRRPAGRRTPGVVAACTTRGIGAGRSRSALRRIRANSAPRGGDPGSSIGPSTLMPKNPRGGGASAAAAPAAGRTGRERRRAAAATSAARATQLRPGGAGASRRGTIFRFDGARVQSPPWRPVAPTGRSAPARSASSSASRARRSGSGRGAATSAPPSGRPSRASTPSRTSPRRPSSGRCSSAACGARPSGRRVARLRAGAAGRAWPLVDARLGTVREGGRTRLLLHLDGAWHELGPARLAARRGARAESTRSPRGS